MLVQEVVLFCGCLEWSGMCCSVIFGDSFGDSFISGITHLFDQNKTPIPMNGTMLLFMKSGVLYDSIFLFIVILMR